MAETRDGYVDLIEVEGFFKTAFSTQNIAYVDTFPNASVAMPFGYVDLSQAENVQNTSGSRTHTTSGSVQILVPYTKKGAGYIALRNIMLIVSNMMRLSWTINHVTQEDGSIDWVATFTGGH